MQYSFPEAPARIHRRHVSSNFASNALSCRRPCWFVLVPILSCPSTVVAHLCVGDATHSTHGSSLRGADVCLRFPPKCARMARMESRNGRRNALRCSPVTELNGSKGDGLPNRKESEGPIERERGAGSKPGKRGEPGCPTIATVEMDRSALDFRGRMSKMAREMGSLLRDEIGGIRTRCSTEPCPAEVGETPVTPGVHKH